MLVELTENCVFNHKLNDNNIAWNRNFDIYFRTIDLRSVRGDLLAEEFQDRICDACRPVIEKRIEDKRKKVWDDTPKHFGLGSWDIVQTKLKTWMEDNA